MAHSVSTIGYLQLVLSIQTSEFKMILNIRVEAWAAYIAAQTEWLAPKMLKLHWFSFNGAWNQKNLSIGVWRWKICVLWYEMF